MWVVVDGCGVCYCVGAALVTSVARWCVDLAMLRCVTICVWLVRFTVVCRLVFAFVILTTVCVRGVVLLGVIS